MRNKVLLSIALLLILVSASLFTYPEVSKQVAQGQNDVVISRFDKTAENVQGDDGGKDGKEDDGNDSGYSTYEEAAADGAVRGGHLRLSRRVSNGFGQAVSGQRRL